MPSFSVETLLDDFVSRNASDLYLIAGSRPSMRTEGGFSTVGDVLLSADDVNQAMRTLLPASVVDAYEATQECNTAINWRNGKARLRLNLFRQRQMPAMVLRRIITRIPTLEELTLPAAYAGLIMEKRGLILITGPAGSGKSTSMAAMIGHRNRNGSGHIVTIEDPVEFLHEHQRCIVSQRDVGVDTESFGVALKNALRQSPDVILIGEIRDADTMENAITFAETGHLVLATLHANNANQAIERVINFFPEEKHRQVLLNLSLNLRGILSQRLVPTIDGRRALAVEIMLNQGLIRSLIEEGKIRELKECIEKARDQGMQSFDQALYELYLKKQITQEIALAESDNPASLRLQFTQRDIERKMTAFQTSGANSGL